MTLKIIMSLIMSMILVSAAAWNQPAAAQEGPVATDGALGQVLFEDMTLVWLQAEIEEYALTACAGNGLNNIQPLAGGPMVLIPNAGDLSLAGSNVAIRLDPDGQINFIPRTQGQRIRVPVNVGDKVAGQEVPSLTLDEGRQMIAAGQLIWTADNQGPYGNGHGLPGHIAACDPQFDEAVWDRFTDDDDEDEES